MKYLFALTLFALALGVPAAGAASATVKHPSVAVICYSGDPVVLVAGAGSMQFGAQSRATCENGSSGAGAYLHFVMNGAGGGTNALTNGNWTATFIAVLI